MQTREFRRSGLPAEDNEILLIIDKNRAADLGLLVY